MAAHLGAAAEGAALLAPLRELGAERDTFASVPPVVLGDLAMVELRHMGGAIARQPAGAGARASLPGTLAMLSLGVAEDEAAAATARTYLDGVDRAVGRYRAGDYPNFVMEPSDASGFFDADTWARLRRTKATYDPGDMFEGNHHIPPAEAG
jgi:hypothetical protein